MKWIPLFAAALLVGLTSCRKNKEVVTYTVDKEQPKNPHQQANPHEGAMPSIPLGSESGEEKASDPHVGMPVLQGPAISDEPAPHWNKGKTNAMRMASYQVEADDGRMIDISFTTLRSAPGGLLMNLNRWCEQVGQKPMDDKEMEASCTSLTTQFGEAVVIDVAGSHEKTELDKDGRIIGAIAEQEGRAWFFKLRGNAELAGNEKEAFLKWAASLKPAEAVPQVAPVVTDQAVEWTLPEGWTVTYGGQSRHSTIHVPGDDPAELAVSFFPGDVGGDVANVNRWLGQIGLKPLTEEGVLPLIVEVEAGPKTFSLVDLKGPQKRMLAAWTRHGEHTWFFKWTGSDAALDAGLMKTFISSVRFNSPE